MSRFIAWSVSILCVCALSAVAQNKVVFDNQSGEPALVKLIGPTTTDVEVASGAKAGADAKAGRYTIKVRYGTAGKYSYSKGDEFEVTETATARSETTITLHKVVAGNYDAKPISEGEFGATASPLPATDRGSLPTAQNQPTGETIKIDWATPNGEPATKRNFLGHLRDLSYARASSEKQLVSFVVSVQGPDGGNKTDLDCFAELTNQSGQVPGQNLMMAVALATDNADISGKILISVGVHLASKGPDKNERGYLKTVRGSLISNVVTAELVNTYTRPAGSWKAPAIGAAYWDLK